MQSVSDVSESTTQQNWPPNLLRLLLGALFAAGLGFVVLKTLYPVFAVPEEISKFPEQSPRWMYERLDKTQSEVDGKNLMLVFGVIGGLLGASSVLFAFGFKAFKSLMLAIVATAALGVAGAYLSNRVFNNLVLANGNNVTIWGITLDTMKQTILGYSLLWGLLGMGVGIGIGAKRGFSKSLVAGVAGLCGGVLGAMMYVILTAQFSVGTLMNRVLPYTQAHQAIWLVLFASAIAVCIALGTGEKRIKPAQST